MNFFDAIAENLAGRRFELKDNALNDAVRDAAYEVALGAANHRTPVPETDEGSAGAGGTARGGYS